MSIFGGDTGISYEQLQRRRKIADAMGKEAMGAAPRNVGEGVNAIAAALVGRYQQKRFDKDAEKFRGQRGDADPLVQALMTGQVPKYANGTNYHPGGMAVVGEEGPELVMLPSGAMVLPSELSSTLQDQMMRADGGDAFSEFQRMQQPGFTPPAGMPSNLNDQMMRSDGGDAFGEFEQMQRRGVTAPSEMPSNRNDQMMRSGGGDAFDEFQRMQQGAQLRPWHNGGLDGSSFDDSRAYQVAQANTGIMNDASPDLSFGALDTGGDAVTVRGITNEEINFRSAASRLSNIDAMLSENSDLLDSLTFQGDIRRRALALKNKFGAELTGDQEEYLTGSTVFRQNILRNINRTIKEVTGAQMGEEEAKRIRAEMPDVDAGPVEFKAKLSAAMDMIRMDIARLNLWQKSGREGKASEITDEQLRQTLRNAGSQYYEQALSQGLSPSEARLEASRLLSQEYGI